MQELVFPDLDDVPLPNGEGPDDVRELVEDRSDEEGGASLTSTEQHREPRGASLLRIHSLVT